MKSRVLLAVAALLVGVTALLAQTPLTPLFNLRGVTDSSGALYTTSVVGQPPDTPLTALGNLRGRTDSTGALYVVGGGTMGAITVQAGATDAVAIVSPDGNPYALTIKNTTFLPSNLAWGWYVTNTGALSWDSSTVNTAVEFSQSGVVRQAGVAFASLGTPTNGSLIYCTDCTFANPCAGAGTGAFAKRLAGAWRCD